MQVALVGLGKTGRFVAKLFAEKGVLRAAFCRDCAKHKKLGETLDVALESVDNLIPRLRADRIDVLVDFSRAEFLRRHMAEIAESGVHIVTAITEFTEEDLARFQRIAVEKRTGFVIVPNITYGVNVMMQMMQMAATLMNDYDFEIIEEHHNQKKDIPSGTAKKMAAKIDEILERHCDYDDKVTPVHSIRSGGLIGKHKVIIAGKYDKIEIIHESFSRMAFAEGAYKAAEFIRDKVGFYEMEDLLRDEQKKVLLSDRM